MEWPNGKFVKTELGDYKCIHCNIRVFNLEKDGNNHNCARGKELNQEAAGKHAAPRYAAHHAPPKPKITPTPDLNVEREANVKKLFFS